MKILKTLLPGTYLLEPFRAQDPRGAFVKPFAVSTFETMGFPFAVQEIFYSMSHNGVIRGMHFQSPPFDYDKLVVCVSGQILDVVLDLRPGSGFGQVASVPLSAEMPQVLWIPKGVAHGFLSKMDNSMVLYAASQEHAPMADAGVRFDSFGFDWGINDPIVSERDQAHPSFIGFQPPFKGYP